MNTRFGRQAALVAASVVACPVFAGETITGLVRTLGGGEALVRFDSDLALITTPPVAISGLMPGEELVGLDRRPKTGALYALSNQNRLYTLDESTGAATQVGAAPFTPALSGSDFGFDFNPVPDRIRVVSDANQNLRLHPDTGAVAATDGTLAFAAGDMHAGADPRIVAAGYINSERCPLTTALYVIDADLDILALQNPPNDGVLATIGSLGVDATASTSLDISSRTNTAFMTTTSLGGLITTLYTVDLTTGEATAAGALNLNLVGVSTLKAIAGPPPCDADFNRDGFVDFFDYDAYVTAFETGDARADLTCDRFLDFFDYDEFVMSFESGC